MNDTTSFLVFALFPAGSGVLLFICTRFSKADSARPSWLRLATINALVMLFLISLMFLGFETYYRFIYDTTDSFNCTKTSVRWHMRYYQTNSLSFRDNVDYELLMPAGKRRITFLGDSFTAGHGIKDVEDRFANRIRQSNPQWDVQVLALEGLDTEDEYKTLKKFASQGYQLDQVVLVYCLNDIADLVPEWNKILARVYGQNQEQNWLVRSSYFADVLHYRLKARRDPDLASYYHFVLAAYRGPIWEQQKDRLMAIRHRVESEGGCLLVVTFPFLHAPLDATYEYRSVHQQLAEFWRQLNVPQLDLLAVYQGLTPRTLVVNRFDAHPSRLAHRLAAEAIQRFLDDNLAPQTNRTTTAGQRAAEPQPK